MVDVNVDVDADVEATIISDESTAIPFQCVECGIHFKSWPNLHNHLLHHIKQPRVVLERLRSPPIKLTIKTTKDKGFAVVTSLTATPSEAEAAAAEASAAEETAASIGADDNLLGDETPSAVEGAAEVDAQEAPEDDFQETAEDDVQGDNQEDEDDYATNGAGDGMELEIEGEPEEHPGDEEVAETDDGTISNNEETEFDAGEHSAGEMKHDEGVVIPGGEPTPPPDTPTTPDLPKIRIKTGLVRDHLPANTESDSDSNILTNLMFTDHDRAKDLGFTTIDPDFSAQDAANTNAITPFRTTANNLTGSLGNLPMQQLAQHVSRFHSPASNGMHQQNVLINIQQFQQPPVGAPPPPPTVHPPYPPQMYQQQPTSAPPPPMYRHPMHQAPPPMQYPYSSANPGYYPPPPAYMHPGQPPHHQMQPPPRPSQPMVNDLLLRRPPPAYRRTGMQQPPMPNPGNMNPQIPRPLVLPQPQQPAPQFRPNTTMSNRAYNQSLRMRMPILQERLQTPTAKNVRAPMHNVQKRNVPHAHEGPTGVKRMRMDKPLITAQSDDADCQVIAISQKNGGLPQIQSVQGNVTEPNNLVHLSESITVSLRTPSPKQREVRSEAKEVADVLASRGITITTTPKGNNPSDSPTMSTQSDPVSINLNNYVTIIPKHKDDKDNKDRESTVDLTEDELAVTAVRGPTAMKPPPPPLLPAKNNNGVIAAFECHLCPAKFHTTTQLMKHRKLFHRTSNAPEFGIPLVDLKSPGATQRLSNLGIFHYIPLPNSQSNGMFAIPILSPSNLNVSKASNAPDLATSILTLGPIKPIATLRPAAPRGRPNS